jgi:hypothetical protein
MTYQKKRSYKLWVRDTIYRRASRQFFTFRHIATFLHSKVLFWSLCNSAFMDHDGLVERDITYIYCIYNI